jgi:putative acetyltransferase
VTIVVQQESPDQPSVVDFLGKADERSSALYPSQNRVGPPLAALLADNIRFFVARADGRALGCGGYAVFPDGSAEMKRLFVDPASRGQGVGLRLVQAIETAAAQDGVRQLFLETGVKSHEALGLYRRIGFKQCGPFGSYANDPLSIFMVKSLQAA